MRPAFYTDIKNLQVTLDAGSCSSRIVFNVPKAHSMGVEFELSARPAPRPRPLGSSAACCEAEFDSTLPGALAAIDRHPRRQPPAVGAEVPDLGQCQLRLAGADATTRYVSASCQHVGSRYTQPSDQENNPRTFVSGLPFGGATGNARDDRRPEAAGL